MGFSLKKQKKVDRNDKWYVLAKEQGYRSRAAFKLAHINKEFDLITPRTRVVLDLCAAPGGWAQVAAKAAGHGAAVIAVDLLPIRPIPNVRTIVGDITLDQTHAVVRREAKEALARFRDDDDEGRAPGGNPPPRRDASGFSRGGDRGDAAGRDADRPGAAERTKVSTAAADRRGTRPRGRRGAEIAAAPPRGATRMIRGRPTARSGRSRVRTRPNGPVAAQAARAATSTACCATARRTSARPTRKTPSSRTRFRSSRSSAASRAVCGAAGAS